MFALLYLAYSTQNYGIGTLKLISKSKGIISTVLYPFLTRDQALRRSREFLGFINRNALERSRTPWGR
jgi:hypothetical protein